MKSVTLKQVLSWHPCESYDEKRIRRLFRGRKALSALDILNMRIPTDDKFWAVLREEFFTKKELRLINCDFAESVLHIFEKKYPNDDRPRKAIEAGRTKGAVAGDAAGAAAWDAAGDAAGAAEKKKQIKIIKKYIKGTK